MRPCYILVETMLSKLFFNEYWQQQGLDVCKLFSSQNHVSIIILMVIFFWLPRLKSSLMNSSARDKKLCFYPLKQNLEKNGKDSLNISDKYPDCKNRSQL